MSVLEAAKISKRVFFFFYNFLSSFWQEDFTTVGLKWSPPRLSSLIYSSEQEVLWGVRSKWSKKYFSCSLHQVPIFHAWNFGTIPIFHGTPAYSCARNENEQTKNTLEKKENVSIIHPWCLCLTCIASEDVASVVLWSFFSNGRNIWSLSGQMDNAETVVKVLPTVWAFCDTWHKGKQNSSSWDILVCEFHSIFPKNPVCSKQGIFPASGHSCHPCSRRVGGGGVPDYKEAKKTAGWPITGVLHQHRCHTWRVGACGAVHDDNKGRITSSVLRSLPRKKYAWPIHKIEPGWILWMSHCFLQEIS